MVDSFFTDPSKRKRKNRSNGLNGQSKQKRHHSRASGNSRSNDAESEDDIDENEAMNGIFDQSDDENGVSNGVKNDEDSEGDDDEEEEEEKEESAADRRRRLAKQYLEDLKATLGGGEEDESNYEFSAKDLDEEIISSRLKKDVAEQKGWIYKFYGDKLHFGKDIKRKVSRVANMGLTSVAVHWPYLYTTSKDIELTKWDIRDAGKNPAKLKTVKGGIQFADLSKEHSENNHCDEIYACTVSPDGKYVVTGGKDGRIIVWSTNSLSCIRVLETKNRKGEVLSLAFRRNSDQLYVACADLKIRTYSINQLAQLETLYGHQDVVTDISALALERCVSVGSRDRTALLWKIADETRLTFRGGDSYERWEKLRKRHESEGRPVKEEEFYFEGSIDCVSMIDDSHFVTGSDNGNVSLWSLAKKKPIFTVRLAHGLQPKELPINASAERNQEVAVQQVPAPQPFWITAIHSLPYSDIFITGSWDGLIRIWKISPELRGFDLLHEIEAKGIVTRIEVMDDEENNELRIYASLSKEHRLGRWIKPLPGAKNALFTYIVKLAT